MPYAYLKRPSARKHYVAVIGGPAWSMTNSPRHELTSQTYRHRPGERFRAGNTPALVIRALHSLTYRHGAAM